ncbi:MAG TPA: hypothetical protein VGG80_12420, partial [Acidobacteriaceae bacterium]
AEQATSNHYRIGVAETFSTNVIAALTRGLAPRRHPVDGFGRGSPMMKMIQILKLMKRNSGLALSTIFGRVIWP